MARFKVNDLITNGSETLWVTEVTDTRYVFTDQDGYHSTRRFEQIDSCFRLYETKKIWHKPDEPIENDAEVLIEYENGFHDVACYIKDEDVFDTGACRPIRKHITRWAYIKDLVDL